MSNLTNPLQSLISQAGKLQTSGVADEYKQRSSCSSGDNILIVDISGSMGEWCGGQRKIDILVQAIQPIQHQYQVLAFNSSASWITNQMPEPCGGTALHLALQVAATVHPAHTLVVSDGQPDDESQAIAAAKIVSGTISTLYVGNDSDHKAIDFMRRLARLGCGKSYVQDLHINTSPLALEGAIRKALPPGGA